MGRRSTALSSIASGLCRLLAVAGLSAAACVSPGCGSGPPRPADPVAAREALERTLAAWKEGKTPESLKDAEPPIVVSDHACSSVFNGRENASVDSQPCGGTHVKSTGEVGEIHIGKIEKKGRENRRFRIRFGPMPAA